MTNYFFWKDWSAGNQFLYVVFLMLFFALMGSSIYMFEAGNSIVIGWEKQGDLEVVDIVIDRFDKHFFEFTQEADAYLLKESYKATDIQVPLYVYYAYLFLLALGTVILLAALPDLPVIPFLAGMGIIILTWATMGFESLKIFYQVYDKLFAMAFILTFSLLAFFFHYIKKGVAVYIRFVCFALVFTLAYFALREFTQVLYPVVHLSVYGIAFPIVIAILFILFNAHEIYRFFLYLTTNRSLNSGRNNAQRFWFLSLLYLGHAIYVYFYFAGEIDWDIYYIHPIYLFVAMSFLGIWGMSAREVQYESLIAFGPVMAFLYIGMGIIAATAIAYPLATANTPLNEVFEDVVVYSQVGFGAGAMLYVFANFKDILPSGQPVYKIYYKPLQFDYLYKLFTAGLVIGSLLLYGDFFTYRQAFAGYFNGLGDLHKMLEDDYTSKQYYGIATGYDPRNHRSFYSLGQLALSAKDEAAAEIFFEDAVAKKPSPYGYALLGDIQFGKKKFLQAILTYQEGIERCEDNSQLYNNLALMLNEREMLPDSVFLYFDAGIEKAPEPEVLQSNMFTLWTKYNIYQNLDSVYGDQKRIPYIGTASNELAFLNAYEQDVAQPFDYSYVPDSIINTPQLCYVYNYALNVKGGASKELVQLLEKLIAVEDNFLFTDYLKFALANCYYYKGELGKALELIQDVFFSSSRTNPDFAYYLGGWMLEMEEYEKAADYYHTAYLRGKQEALLNEAVCRSELEDKSEAIDIWLTLKDEGRNGQKEVAKDMLRFLVKDSLNTLNLANANDLGKYRYLHYNQTLPDVRFEGLFNSIKEPKIKSVIAIERVHFAIDQKNETLAGKYLKLAAASNIQDEVQPLFQQAYLRYVAYQEKFDEEFIKRVNEATFNRLNKSDQYFYRALYYAAVLKEKEAIEAFENAIELNPIKANYYLEWAAYYQELDQVEKAYDVLLAGVETNPESVPLIEAYILQSLNLRYTTFAESMLEELKNYTSSTRYQEFLQVYKDKLAEVEKSFEQWSN